MLHQIVLDGSWQCTKQVVTTLGRKGPKESMCSLMHVVSDVLSCGAGILFMNDLSLQYNIRRNLQCKFFGHSTSFCVKAK